MAETSFEYTQNTKEMSVKIQDSVEKRSEKKRSPKWIWLVLKTLLFIVCSTFYLSQLIEIYKHFYEYPTTTSIKVVNPEYYKMPAVTICLRNVIKRSEFCAENSNRCEEPSELELFCANHPDICKKNTSDLKIPILGYYTHKSPYLICLTKDAVQRMLLDGVQNNSLFSSRPWQKWKPIYVYDYELSHYERCYSDNLHISSRDKPYEMKIDEEEQLRKFIQRTPLPIVNIHNIDIKVDKEELIYPWIQNQAVISLHSPFAPVNPYILGKPLKLGHRYNIYVQMEEERLLPHPFSTNCTNYEALWERNNKTGPRSKEMCQELCVKKSISNRCETLQSMFEHPGLICRNMGCEHYRTFINRDDEFLQNCMENCKPNCLKQKYHFTVEDDIPEDNLERSRNKISVSIFLSDRHVTVISHNRLYEIWDLFYKIGGLVGCWLAISLWTLVGIP